MSGDVTPESLRALADDVLARAADDRDGDLAGADSIMTALRAAADALEAAEAKLAQVREWRANWQPWTTTWDTEDGGPSTYATGLDGLDAILDDTGGDEGE